MYVTLTPPSALTLSAGKKKKEKYPGVNDCYVDASFRVDLVCGEKKHIILAGEKEEYPVVNVCSTDASFRVDLVCRRGKEKEFSGKKKRKKN
jgi:hypothetical protein